MNRLLLAAIPLPLVVLAAHFWRAGDLAFAAIALGCACFTFVRRPWAARAMQVALVLGAIEWLRTLAALVATRQSLGMPYVRLSAILATVALATLIAALAFEAKSLRAHYRRSEAPPV